MRDEGEDILNKNLILNCIIAI